MTQPERDDFGIGAGDGEEQIRLLGIHANELPLQADTSDGGGAAAHEGVEHEVTGVGGGEQAAFDEGDGLLGGMFAVSFFGTGGGGESPDGGRSRFPSL